MDNTMYLALFVFVISYYLKSQFSWISIYKMLPYLIYIKVLKTVISYLLKLRLYIYIYIL